MRKHFRYISLGIRTSVLAVYSILVFFQREQMVWLVESEILGLRIGDGMGMGVALALAHQLLPSGTNRWGRDNLFETENVTGKPSEKRKERARRSATRIFFLWLFGLFLLSGIHVWQKIPVPILILLTLVLWVLDTCCILIFCPFNAFILRQKCCRACRIHRWDVLFIVTPLMLIPAWSVRLVVLSALAVTLQWERAFRRHPERFFEETNPAIRCSNCTSICTRKRRYK